MSQQVSDPVTKDSAQLKNVEPSARVLRGSRINVLFKGVAII